ncbi:MAG TPA: thioredoxin family protein [Saprospiraceae bacterium]|nr:thioredoxin family protein [Saprospiraceae bacterium]
MQYYWIKLIIFTWVCLFGISFSPVASQGIQFFEGSWEEALEKANRENKIIFVDAFAKWCGPCKVMAKNVFPHEKVGQFYNRSFINMKLDMEESEGRAFGKKFPVNAYPTLLFIDGDGNLVTKHVGGMQVDPFIELGKKAFALGLSLSKYAELYREGDRSYTTVFHYIKALQASGESTLKVANEYLLSKPDITKKEEALLVYEAVTEADSRLFDMMVTYKDVILTVMDDEQYKDKVMDACNATLLKSIEFDFEGLKTESLEKCITALGKKDSEEMIYRLEMNYYGNSGEKQQYLKVVDRYAKKMAKKDPDVYRHILSHATLHYGEQANVILEIIPYGEALYKESGSSDDAVLFIRSLASGKQYDYALKFLNKIEKDLEPNDKNAQQLTQIRRYLEAMVKGNM